MARRRRRPTAPPAPRFMLLGRRWPYGVGLLLLAVAIGFEAISARPVRPAPTSTHDPRFPELADVDQGLVAELRGTWPGSFGSGPEVSVARDGFTALCRRHGVEAARAILSVLLRAYRDRAGGSDFRFGPLRDQEALPGAWMMGELADAGVRGLLVRALPLRDFHPAFRRALAVALCRPKHAAARAALLDRVLDRQEDNGFRSAILLRLHRFGGDPPRRLRALLGHPFAQLDFFAAGTLGRMGDDVGVALIRDGLRFLYEETWLAPHLAMAANRLTGRNHPISKNPPYGRPRSEWTRRRVEKHLAAIEARFRTSPDPLLSPSSFEEVLASGEDFDVAAASMLLTEYKPAWIRVELDRLDRLAGRLRGELKGVSDAEQRIKVLNRALLVRRSAVDVHASASSRVSYLPAVFEQDHGNCLGYSTLYVVLGDRLGLPLYAVSSPNHCFVRYDDGKLRRNIETTNLGRAKSDGEYFSKRERERVPDALSRGVFLRNRTKRQLLAAILSNYAFTCSFGGDYEGAEQAAERALRLDPDNHLAHYQLAFALFHRAPRARIRVKQEIAAAIRIYPGHAGVLFGAGWMSLGYGETRRALGYFEDAHELDRANRSLAWSARARARLGGAAVALTRLEEPLRRTPDSAALRLSELECRIRLDLEDTSTHVARARTRTDFPLVVGMVAAETLLALGRASGALEQLEAVRKLADRNDSDRPLRADYRTVLDPRDASRRSQYRLILARTLHALGRGGADAALREAERLRPADHDILLVRELLAR